MLKRPTKARIQLRDVSHTSQTIASISVLVVFVILGAWFVQASHAATSFVAVEPEQGTITVPAKKVTDAQASGGAAVQFTTAPDSPPDCTVTDKLVNPCRPWIGAFSLYYPGVTGFKAASLDHEARIGRQVDIIHQYHPPPKDDGSGASLPLSADEKYFVGRDNTILLTNWKPADKFVDAAGGKPVFNALIDQAADNFNATRALYPTKKVMLSIYHEPENDISYGETCTGLKGSKGSPAEYRAMWQNVRSRFDAKGVSNVVWVMNYMGFSNWNCMVKDLWPGNGLVDWVTWDPYGDPVPDAWAKSITPFYTYLSNNSDADHNFLSKPWGLSEFGMWNSPQNYVYEYYDDAKASVEANQFPRIKAYVDFDTIGINDHRILYDQHGVLDSIEQDHYKAFANSPSFH